MRILITGMCGFIGHHVADWLLTNTDWQIVGLDRIDATSTMHRLRHIPDWADKSKRVKFVWHDLRAPIPLLTALTIGDVDIIAHLAASTHVDRSITDPYNFLQDNVIGTYHILEYARGQKLSAYFQMSTDEVFGPCYVGDGLPEWAQHNPSNPYSASKSAADALVCAYGCTYGLPYMIMHGMNMIGERQHPEKFIPKAIRSIIAGEKLRLHAAPSVFTDGPARVGSRFYLHASNIGAAVKFLLDKPRMERWNIVGDRELFNDELVLALGTLIGKSPEYEYVYDDKNRPGHDLRYALDGSKMAALGWKNPVPLDEGLRRAVDFYLKHPEWLL